MPRGTFYALSALTRLLLVQKAKEIDVKVDAELNKELRDIQRQSGVADPDKFQQFIHDQTGLPFEDFQAERKNDLLRQRVIRLEVSSKIQIKKDEILAYYDAHHDEFHL